MTRKRREYQRHVERKRWIAGLCGIVLLFFGILCAVSGIVSNAITLRHINHGNLKEYTGSYTYVFIRPEMTSAESYYKFTLGNGDVITISKEECKNENILEDSPELTVQYAIKPFTDRYHAVSITTSDGTVVIRSLSSTRGWCIAFICFLAIMILMLSGFIFGIVSLDLFDWKNRYQNWRRKIRKKHI